MKTKKIATAKEDVDQQFQEDSFLIKVTQKKPSSSSEKPPTNWEKIVAHGKKHSILYFLLLAITFIGFLIFQFQLIYQFEGKERNILELQINNMASESGIKHDSLKNIKQGKKTEDNVVTSSLDKKGQNQLSSKPNELPKDQKK